MTLIARTDVFKGKLLELIGRPREEILKSFAPPDIRIEGTHAERFLWREEFFDDATERTVSATLMVRLLRGSAWSVGVHVPQYLFFVNVPRDGEPYLGAHPRPLDVDERLVNWVRKDALGNYFNHGLGY